MACHSFLIAPLVISTLEYSEISSTLADGLTKSGSSASATEACAAPHSPPEAPFLAFPLASVPLLAPLGDYLLFLAEDGPAADFFLYAFCS